MIFNLCTYTVAHHFPTFYSVSVPSPFLCLSYVMLGNKRHKAFKAQTLLNRSVTVLLGHRNDNAYKLGISYYENGLEKLITYQNCHLLYTHNTITLHFYSLIFKVKYKLSSRTILAQEFLGIKKRNNK